MRVSTLALLSATTVGTLGTVVALPLDAPRASALLQKARKEVSRATRAGPSGSGSGSKGKKRPRLSRSGDSTPSDSPEPELQRSSSADTLGTTPSLTRSASASSALSKEVDSRAGTDETQTPSTPPLPSHSRTPHRATPAIRVVLPDSEDYFDLRMDSATTLGSPTSVLSPKEDVRSGWSLMGAMDGLRV